MPKDENDKLIPSDVDYVDTWKAMEECVRLGLTKSIGLSNFNSEQIQRVLDIATIRPVVNQVTQEHEQSILRAAFIRWKFARASQVPGMRTQTFHASRIMEVTARFKVQPVVPSITCMKRLPAHLRDLTRAREFASCKHGFNYCYRA
jgi:hypothetical protein